MIKVYGAKWCSYCNKTKALLDNYGYQYEFIDIDEDLVSGQYLLNNNFKTIPQIWFDSYHVGGYDNLIERLNDRQVIVIKGTA